MKYKKTITLKNGQICCLRNGMASDAKEVLENFKQVHAQTDFLLTYPEEMVFTEEQEAHFLKAKKENAREVFILAFVEDDIAGSAVLNAIGKKQKVQHGVDFGITVHRGYWGLGIGRALTEACIECARKAGYTQMELSVVAGNERAISLYKNLGFVEFGRNPQGFLSRLSGFQEVIDMRLEL